MSQIGFGRLSIFLFLNIPAFFSLHVVCWRHKLLCVCEHTPSKNTGLSKQVQEVFFWMISERLPSRLRERRGRCLYFRPDTWKERAADRGRGKSQTAVKSLLSAISQVFCRLCSVTKLWNQGLSCAGYGKDSVASCRQWTQVRLCRIQTHKTINTV